MSGYAGPDCESEHALILAENGIKASQMALMGQVRTTCLDCGGLIPEARRELAMKYGHKCDRCVTCQHTIDQRPRQRIRMLDHIL